MKNPDIRTDVISDIEYNKNCEKYADWAFFTPPEEFLFYHYDELPQLPENILYCSRPMIGMEKYTVSGVNGNYGVYDTRDVVKFIQTKTWIIIDSKDIFIKRDIRELENKLKEKKDELIKYNETNYGE